MSINSRWLAPGICLAGCAYLLIYAFNAHSTRSSMLLVVTALLLVVAAVNSTRASSTASRSGRLVGWTLLVVVTAVSGVVWLVVL